MGKLRVKIRMAAHRNEPFVYPAAYALARQQLYVSGRWIALGYFLGNVPLIADNIELALLMVVAVSLIPIAIEVIKSRRAKKAHAAG